MTTRQSALFALFLGTFGLLALSGCSAGNPNMDAAESAMEQSDYDRALANVDSVLMQDSANVDALMMKARILRQKADSTMSPNQYKDLYKRARMAEEKAIEFDPGRRSGVKEQRELAYLQEFQKGADMFNAARKNQKKSDYMRAAAHFGAASAIQPDSAGAILNEAFARLRAARLEEGDKAAQGMTKVVPILERYIDRADQPTKNAYTILGQLYLQDDQFEKVIVFTEEAIDDLSSRDPHFRLSGTQGVEYSGTIEVNGSSRSVEGTIPDRISLSTSEGDVSGAFVKKEGGKRQTKGRLSISIYKQGTEAASGRTTSPSDTVSVSANLSEMTPLAELENYRLTALNRSGKTKQAMQVYRERIEENPNDETYRYNYGSLLLNADRYEEAAEQLKKAVELDPNDPKKQYNLGAAYLNRGVMLQDSLVTLRDSLLEKDRNPTEEERKQVKKLDERRLNSFQNAIPPLERARQLSGRRGQYRQSACSALFQAYVQTEQTEKAEQVKRCAGQDAGSSEGSNGMGSDSGGNGR